jgi:hypothetical protein
LPRAQYPAVPRSDKNQRPKDQFSWNADQNLPVKNVWRFAEAELQNMFGILQSA